MECRYSPFELGLGSTKLLVVMGWSNRLFIGELRLAFEFYCLTTCPRELRFQQYHDLLIGPPFKLQASIKLPSRADVRLNSCCACESSLMRSVCLFHGVRTSFIRRKQTFHGVTQIAANRAALQPAISQRRPEGIAASAHLVRTVVPQWARC